MKHVLSTVALILILPLGSAGAACINLTNGNDNYVGNSGVNCVNGLGGNDVLDGKGGSDILNGGLGTDRLIGTDGTYTFESASDILTGGDGLDVFVVSCGLYPLGDITNSVYDTIRNYHTSVEIIHVPGTPAGWTISNFPGSGGTKKIVNWWNDPNPGGLVCPDNEGVIVLDGMSPACTDNRRNCAILR